MLAIVEPAKLLMMQRLSAPFMTTLWEKLAHLDERTRLVELSAIAVAAAAPTTTGPRDKDLCKFRRVHENVRNNEWFWIEIIYTMYAPNLIAFSS